MQQIDTESGKEQRRRYNRVSKIKNSIVTLLSVWVVLSMILITCLFVLLFQTRSQVEELNAKIETIDSVGIGNEGEDEMEVPEEDSQVPIYSELEGYEPAIPIATNHKLFQYWRSDHCGCYAWRRGKDQ